MLTIQADQSLVANGSHKLRHKNGRKPLQPRNFQTNPSSDELVQSKRKQEWIEISSKGISNKENHHQQQHQHNHHHHHLLPKVPSAVPVMESIDASLAEELSVIRKRIERLRLEKEKTERMLRERDLRLEIEMERMERRGIEQKKVEIEVEKLQRLRELRSSLLRATRIKSLREIEEERKMKEAEDGKLEETDKEITKKSEVVEQICRAEVDDSFAFHSTI